MILKNDQEIIQSYFEDESGLLGGHAEVVIVPESYAEAAEYLREASRRGMPVTVSGGGTGVTGGRVPFGGAVLSLERLNNVLAVSRQADATGTITVQAGATVKTVKDAAKKEGLLYAPDPTEQNAFIGGNVATNASGSRGFKYGSTRRYVRALKVILPDGSLLAVPRGKYFADSAGKIFLPGEAGGRILRIPELKSAPDKNAAGYFSRPGMDLIDLFIGQEGTLGVIVEVTADLLPAIPGIAAGVAFFPSEGDAWDFVEEARSPARRVDPLSLEYFDRHALALLAPDYPAIPAGSGAAVLFEQAAGTISDEELLTRWTALIEKHHADPSAVWFGISRKEEEAFREFRHRLPEKVNEIVRRNRFPKTGTDIAVPAPRLREMMEIYRREMGDSGIAHLVFGHIGESHLHANLLPATEEEFKASKALYLRLVDAALALGGTVSAEHGVGKLKHAFLERMYGSAGIAEMTRVKRELDPAGILNLDNLFPANIPA